jgi:hypothetical protein
MRKGVVTQSLAAEILKDCGNLMFAALNFSLIHILNSKYHGNLTYITHVNMCLNMS